MGPSTSQLCLTDLAPVIQPLAEALYPLILSLVEARPMQRWGAGLAAVRPVLPVALDEALACEAKGLQAMAVKSLAREYTGGWGYSN